MICCSRFDALGMALHSAGNILNGFDFTALDDRLKAMKGLKSSQTLSEEETMHLLHSLNIANSNFEEEFCLLVTGSQRRPWLRSWTELAISPVVRDVLDLLRTQRLAK